MKLHDVYPSQWLAASDVEASLTVTVKGLTFAEVGRDKEQKPVLWFEEVEKGLILNKTNWNNMVLITKEDDSDDWVGHQVQLYSTKVQFGGEEVDAVRIRMVKNAAKPSTTGQNTPTLLAQVKKFIADHKEVNIQDTLGTENVNAYIKAGGTMAEVLAKLKAKYELASTPVAKMLDENFEEVDI